MTATSTRATPFAARFLPGAWFYGWYIAVACACLMLVGVGTGYYGLPIFLKPLKEDHGWSDTAVSVAPAIYFTVSGLAGAFIGPYLDRSGPKRFMLVGTVLSAVIVNFTMGVMANATMARSAAKSPTRNSITTGMR